MENAFYLEVLAKMAKLTYGLWINKVNYLFRFKY